MMFPPVVLSLFCLVLFLLCLPLCKLPLSFLALEKRLYLQGDFLPPQLPIDFLWRIGIISTPKQQFFYEEMFFCGEKTIWGRTRCPDCFSVWPFPPCWHS